MHHTGIVDAFVHAFNQRRRDKCSAPNAENAMMDRFCLMTPAISHVVRDLADGIPEVRTRGTVTVCMCHNNAKAK